jgi:hypothetical protein
MEKMENTEKQEIAMKELASYRNRVYSVGYTKIERFFDLSYDLDLELEKVKIVGQSLVRNDEKFIIDDDNKFLYTNLIRWVHGDQNHIEQDSLKNDDWDIIPGSVNKGIIICGATGTGKTLALNVMQRYCETNQLYYSFGGETKRLTWLSVRADKICDFYRDNGTIDQYENARILCIQDIGTEDRPTTYMGTKKDVICKLIENRGDNNLSQLTLFTSNLKVESDRGVTLKQIYGDRVVSRIHAMCNYYELTGCDRRNL